MSNKSHDNYLIGSIDNALRVLTKLGSSSGLSIRELGKDLNISRSTLYRILRTLESKQFVRQDALTEKYSLGVAIIELGISSQKEFDLKKIATPYLINLRDLTGETVQLAILSNDEIILLDNIEGTGDLRFYSPAGLKFPITYGNFGKIFLMNKNKEEIHEAINNHPLKEYTSQSIIDNELYLKELDKIKQLGYSIGINDPIDGGFSVAAPLYNFDGKVIASIALVGPNSQKNIDGIKQISNLVKKVSLDISSELGFKA